MMRCVIMLLVMLQDRMCKMLKNAYDDLNTTLNSECMPG